MYWHFCININTYEVMDFFVLFFFQGTLKMMDVSMLIRFTALDLYEYSLVIPNIRLFNAWRVWFQH